MRTKRKMVQLYVNVGTGVNSKGQVRNQELQVREKETTIKKRLESRFSTHQDASGLELVAQLQARVYRITVGIGAP